MSAHTPGSWHVVPPTRAAHRWVIGTHDESSVASCEPVGPWVSKEEADANARLIAAAPDMLAALQNIENDGKQVPDHAWALIQAAIAKATGAA